MNGNSKKFESFASLLKQDIVYGRFKAGERLPTFNQMESIYKVSRGVLQLAIDLLKQSGFVTSHERKGLFVSKSLPHLHRYAVVFSEKLTENTSRLGKAFLNEIQRLNEEAKNISVAVFWGINDKVSGEKTVKRLENEIADHLVAGVIFLLSAQDLLSRPLFADKQLSKVLVFAPNEYKQAPRVTTNGRQMIDKTFNYFKTQNRTRVAVLHIANTMGDLDENDFKRHGFKLRPQWVQEIGRSHPRTVEKVIPLLMDYPEEKRPDAIFIADDNLVEYSVSSILSLGFQIGRDLDVVGHCNWPWPVPCMVPIKRIGYHMGDILNSCIKIINQQNDGIKLQQDTILPALFEDEVETRNF